MLVEAKQKGFYGGELRVPGERFEVEGDEATASWFEPVDRATARRNAKSGREAEAQ